LPLPFSFIALLRRRCKSLSPTPTGPSKSCTS
jgi:hypothetical protein